LTDSRDVQSRERKEALLGVSGETLRRFGAVSAEVAREMARGARERLNASCAISTTGIAGPDGGSAEKPVGLAYLGYSSSEGDVSERFLFGGSRGDIIARASFVALDLVRRSLGAGIAWSEPSSRS
jgi:nicotinamide-nucleotide amidase